MTFRHPRTSTHLLLCAFACICAVGCQSRDRANEPTPLEDGGRAHDEGDGAKWLDHEASLAILGKLPLDRHDSRRPLSGQQAVRVFWSRGWETIHCVEYEVIDAAYVRYSVTHFGDSARPDLGRRVHQRHAQLPGDDSRLDELAGYLFDMRGFAPEGPRELAGGPLVYIEVLNAGTYSRIRRNGLPLQFSDDFREVAEDYGVAFDYEELEFESRVILEVLDLLGRLLGLPDEFWSAHFTASS